MNWSSILVSISVALADSRTLSFKLQREVTREPLSSGNRFLEDHFRESQKRDTSGTVPDVLPKDGYVNYFAEIFFGSNKQKLYPILDTGSSDLWVHSNYALELAGTPFDSSLPFFNYSQSSTFDATTTPWSIQYMDQSSAAGFLVRDTLNFGGDYTITNATFAAAVQVSVNRTGVFGVGFPGGESQVLFGTEYPNVPEVLRNEGLISTVSYSIYLNDFDAKEGEILFGGVDHAKYEGTLHLVPIVNYEGSLGFSSDYRSIRVIWNGVDVIDKTKGDSNSCYLATFNAPVLLDTGTTYNIIPEEIVQAIANRIGYSYGTSVDRYFSGNCDSVSNFDIELDFSGAKVRFPISDVLDTTFQGEPVNSINGKAQCILGFITSNSISTVIFGDTFLRSLYIVYDLQSKRVAVANAKKGATGSSVEPILSTIPSAISAPNFASTSWGSTLSLNPTGCSNPVVVTTLH